MAHLRLRRDSCRLFGRGDGVHVNRACRRSPLAAETATVRRHVGQVERTARTWTDAHREEARRLQAEGLSWSAIAEQVCGDRRYKSTVQGWLRPAATSGERWQLLRLQRVADLAGDRPDGMT